MYKTKKYRVSELINIQLLYFKNQLRNAVLQEFFEHLLHNIYARLKAILLLQKLYFQSSHQTVNLYFS